MILFTDVYVSGVDEGKDVYMAKSLISQLFTDVHVSGVDEGKDIFTAKSLISQLFSGISHCLDRKNYLLSQY